MWGIVSMKVKLLAPLSHHDWRQPLEIAPWILKKGSGIEQFVSLFCLIKTLAAWNVTRRLNLRTLTKGLVSCSNIIKGSHCCTNSSRYKKLSLIARTIHVSLITQASHCMPSIRTRSRLTAGRWRSRYSIHCCRLSRLLLEVWPRWAGKLSKAVDIWCHRKERWVMWKIESPHHSVNTRTPFCRL